MRFFYSVDGGEAQGPVSEEVLKNLYFQRRIGLDDPVAGEGETEWRTLRIHFPDLEYFRGCPKCRRKVSVEDDKCEHCAFPISNYLANVRKARRSIVTPARLNSDHVEDAFRKRLTQQTGCGFLVLGGILSSILLLIPFIGPYLFGATLLGLVALAVTPVSMKLWLHKKFGAFQTAHDEAMTEIGSSFDGQCPRCAKNFSSLPITGDVFECPSCAKAMFRRGNTVYFVPFPTAVLSTNWDCLFQQRDEPRAERAD